MLQDFTNTMDDLALAIWIVFGIYFAGIAITFIVLVISKIINEIRCYKNLPNRNARIKFSNNLDKTAQDICGESLLWGVAWPIALIVVSVWGIGMFGINIVKYTLKRACKI